MFSNNFHYLSCIKFVIHKCNDFGQVQKLSHLFNSLPNNKFLDRSKFKAFADENINVTQILKFVLGWVEKVVGKGENDGYQHFLLFPQCFQKPSFSGLLKVRIVW